jgi:hypothetical protein
MWKPNRRTSLVIAVLALILVIAGAKLISMAPMFKHRPSPTIGNWTYDWVEGWSTLQTPVRLELPSPYGDRIRELFERHQAVARPDEIEITVPPGDPEVMLSYSKDGVEIRRYRLYKLSIPMVYDGNFGYRLTGQQLAEFEQAIEESLTN